MRLFETIKETVTVEQAAEYYSMKIGRNNMICCPFHNDHHPSMKLNTTYYSVSYTHLKLYSTRRCLYVIIYLLFTSRCLSYYKFRII